MRGIKPPSRKGCEPWNKGKKNVYKKEVLKNWSKKRKGMFKDEKHPGWTGDFGSYSAMHTWVVRNKGKAKKCIFCREKNKKKYCWANKDHKYKRNLDDYMELCYFCHSKYDYLFNGKNTKNGKSEI